MPGMPPMVREGLEVKSHPMDKHPGEEGELEEIEHHAGVKENAKPEVTTKNNDNLIDEDAYWGEGSWYLNTWLPNQHENHIKLETNGDRKFDITVILKTGDILKHTDLTIINLVQKDMDNFGNARQGKRQAGSSGRWWPLSSAPRRPPSLSRRPPWSTGRRSQTAEYIPEKDITEKTKTFLE